MNYTPTTIFFVYQRYDFESKTQFVNRFLGDLDLYDWKNVNRYKAFVEQRSACLMIISVAQGQLPIFQSHHLRLSMQRSIRIFYFSLAILRSCLVCGVTAANLPQPYIRKGGNNISQVAPRVDHKPAKKLYAKGFWFSPLPAKKSSPKHKGYDHTVNRLFREGG